jgi:hypothetical protein
MYQNPLLDRRRLLRAGARGFGALSVGGIAGLLADGCARVPAATTTAGQKLVRLQFQVAGALQSGSSASPYYYFAVLNLTDNPSDPGPVPIRNLPWGNGIAAPPATAAANSQTFVGFVQYDTGTAAYQVWLCPKVTVGTKLAFVPAVQIPSPSAFTNIGQPVQFVAPAGSSANTFDATVDLNQFKANPGDPLPAYVQINFIAYSYLATGTYNGPRYWDAIGDGTTNAGDYAVISTSQSGQSATSATIPEPTGDVQNQFGQTVTSAGDQVIPNLDLTSWAVRIQ